MVTVISTLLIPSAGPLVGVLMFGNLIRECGVVERLSQTIQNELMNIVTIFLGTTIGATAKAETFISGSTLKIIGLGLIAFALGTVGGVLFGKIMCKLTKGKVNPLIGAQGIGSSNVSKGCSKNGAGGRPRKFLLMHAMGPNVAELLAQQ